MERTITMMQFVNGELAHAINMFVICVIGVPSACFALGITGFFRGRQVEIAD